MHSQAYKTERINHWNKIATEDRSNIFSSSYHRRLMEVYKNQVLLGSNIIEIGCGNGDLLASLSPNHGVGVDFSPAQIELAQRRHPELNFICADVCEIISDSVTEKFDYVVISDLVNDLWDVQSAFQRVRPFCHAKTRVLINYYSRVWQPILNLAQVLGLAKRNLEQNWLTDEDLANMLNLSGFEVIKTWDEVLAPIPIPIIEPLLNKYLVKIWPFRLFALANFLSARLHSIPRDRDYTVSVIVPARNESGSIDDILRRIPEMGAGTEIIFVEGNSTDDTYQKIAKALPNYPDRKTCLLKQDGKGKGDAVRKGFAHASGKILMILDADQTVPPEDLPRFYEALADNKGEFINGVRLVYPMEKQAMRFFNFLGNKFFSLAFTYLLGQSVKDTLCGTKVVFKEDYELIVSNRAYFGNFDPFGDYDLLFGAARLGLKIVDLPIRYRERIYGTTNIQRWRHGWLLLKMVLVAARRLKFI
ncbi:MAG: glycosyltransferase [Bellilinea sp.]